jgi:hypothetical protein
MTPDPLNPERIAMAGWHDQQTESPVVEKFTLDELMALGRDQAAVELGRREDAILHMTAYPLTHCWEPAIWRQIDLEVARKRLAHPGRVIEVFITGGMRPGKSFSCARRMTAHWVYTEKATVFALSETRDTSGKLQQQPVEMFLPEEVSPISGKHKSTKHERFKFSGGHFTNEMFSLRVPVSDETERTYLGGGDFVFRFFGQDIGTFQGYELSSAWSDELVPLGHVKAVRERMATRAQQTKRPEFLYRIEQAVKILESGGKLPIALLGALYHGVHLISFTPYLGWNDTVNYFLNGATKYAWETAPDLVGKHGVLDPRVPRFAQPPHDTGLVAYVFTSDNKIKPAYEELSASLRNAPEHEVRIKLYGDVDKGEAVVFSSFGPENLCDWADIPRKNVTLYEVIDFGKAKPPALQWWIVDYLGRRWLAQEWPSPQIGIPMAGRVLLPGAWAVPSETGRYNGDEGPAYRLRLKWDSARIVREIWAMRARLVQKLAETGEPYTGEVRTDKLTWKHPLRDASTELEGPFALPYFTIPDPRGVEETVEGASLGRKYADAENGIYLQPWKTDSGEVMVSAPSDDDGIKFILDSLARDVEGSPLVRINRECENTRFMFASFTLPPWKEGPQKKDEACVEWFDLMKYLESWEPKHIDLTRFRNRPNFEFGY